MDYMMFIVSEILLPIFLIIIAGFFMQKKFKLDLSGLTKVQIYLFIPALIFISIIDSELEGSIVAQIFGFTVLVFLTLMGISYLLAKVLKIERKKEKAFMNAIVLRNQGNFGIPLITLLFASSGDDYAISIHMIVLFATNLLLNTIGLYNASSGTYTKKEALLKVFKLPAIYAIILGFLCKGFSIPVIGGIKASLTLAGSGVVPLALFTLGAQLSDAKLKFADKSLPVAVFARLVLSPLIAFGFVKLFGITGTMASVLIIGASAPTAVNSVLLAIEFDGDSEYASEAVFLTTLLSIVTVTITILFTTS